MTALRHWRFSDGKRWWWLSIISFQLLWFYLLLGYPWPGALLVIGAHLVLTPAVKADLQRALWLAPVGYALDSLWQGLGVIQFQPQGLLPPPWLLMLWVMFSLALPYNFFMLRGCRWLTGAWVALLAPLSYLAGAKLGAATLPLGPLIAYPVLAAGWMVLLPFALRR